MTSLPVQIIIGIAAAAVVAVVAGITRLLKPSGAWAAFVLGTVVFGIGGLAWSIPLLTFFFLSSLLSKLGSRRVRGYREKLQQVFEKGSTRDAGQVLANGGVAGLLVLVHVLVPGPHIYLAYLATLAAAAADTWGTEIGVMSRGAVISLRTLKGVEPGTSGGVSLAGTTGALCGALSIALSGLAWVDHQVLSLIIVVISGLFGMVVDSLIGATIQATYRCPICGGTTERTMHCSHATELLSGRRWVNNDAVNLLCCLAGALVCIALTMLFL
jgi:uncharacterized protein (TIGR00297 family)